MHGCNLPILTINNCSEKGVSTNKFSFVDTQVQKHNYSDEVLGSTPGFVKKERLKFFWGIV